jgi:ABC-type multidrug transport system permease subunit
VSSLAVLVRIRLMETLRRPSGAFWFFALPLILVLLVAVIFHRGHPFERRHVAVVGDVALVAPSLEAHVREGGLVLDRVADEAGARARLESRAVSAAIVCAPRGVRVLVGTRDEIFGRGLVAVVGAGARLETLPLSQNGYVRFLVPGMLAQGVVIAGLFGMGYAMVRYRQSRFLRKLATTPLSRAEFVLAQILARLVLVVVQLLVMLLVARALFDVRITASSVASVLVVGAAGLVSFMGVGFLLSCVVKTEDVVVDIINAVSVPIALLSEIFFSSDELPRPLAWAASFLPSTQMVRAMRAVLLHGDDARAVLFPALAVLAGWAIVTFVVAVRAFKWR